MSNCNRGSEWRIWDLHVHTPESLEHNYRCASDEDVWETYISDLERLPQDIKVLGINDYLFLDGYDKVLGYKEKGRLQNIDVLLPVVEFRIAKFGGNEKFRRINYHVIFSNEITSDQIKHLFLHALSADYKLDPQCNVRWGGVITKDSLEELGRQVINSAPVGRRSQYGPPLKEGFNALNIEVSAIQKALSNAHYIFKGKYLTAIGKTEWDAFKWNDNSIAEKRTIINDVDLVFTASESVDAFYKSYQALTDNKVNNVLLDCSDAHSFSNSKDKDRIGNCWTWIKANTTFEGLKQITYEPEERIRIQIEKPEQKRDYQVIDKIVLNEPGFWEGTICLNPNLNTIVGGRSTGKSTLLMSIAAKTDLELIDVHDDDSQNAKKTKEFIRSHLNTIAVHWKSPNNQERSRQIEFFSQGYMHKIAESESETNILLKNIVADKDNNNALNEFDENIESTSREISNRTLDLFVNAEKISTLEKELHSLGSAKDIQEQISIFQKRATELEKTSQITDSQRKDIADSLEKLKLNNTKIETLNNELNSYEKLLSIDIINPMIDNQILFSNLTDESKQNLSVTVNRIKEDAQKDWEETISNLRNKSAHSRDSLQAENNAIKESEIYKIAQSIYQDNKELKEINEKLSKEKDKLRVVTEKSEIVRQLKEMEIKTIKDIMTANSKFLVFSQELSEKHHFKMDKLEVKVTPELDKEELLKFLTLRLYYNNNDKNDYVNNFIGKYDLNEDVAQDFLLKLLHGELQLKSSFKHKDVANDFFASNWYKLKYTIKYQEDEFEEMSPGKQAFVILKLLLDFSKKECPILIDQPEDSLDNRAIYNELVEYIKSKKRDRQIIIVTHNSNIVVGADSENIIVANQHGINSPNTNSNKFEYKNGALENTSRNIINGNASNTSTLSSQGIREHICDVLEGGEDAFKKREQKYGFER